mmetsp:Transcript_4112/g.7547  ORF Transcript_4112/g.7547 Transcript_4112/m.7547 type:complete len:252 (-) Transcript_4112:1586-2341(-)
MRASDCISWFCRSECRLSANFSFSRASSRSPAIFTSLFDSALYLASASRVAAVCSACTLRRSACTLVFWRIMSDTRFSLLSRRCVSFSRSATDASRALLASLLASSHCPSRRVILLLAMASDSSARLSCPLSSSFSKASCCTSAKRLSPSFLACWWSSRLCTTFWITPARALCISTQYSWRGPRTGWPLCAGTEPEAPSCATPSCCHGAIWRSTKSSFSCWRCRYTSCSRRSCASSLMAWTASWSPATVAE